MKGHFLAGLLVIIPFGAISWIALSVFKLIRRVHHLLPVGWQQAYLSLSPATITLLDVILTLLLIVLLFVGVAILGWFSKQYLGRKVLVSIRDLIQRIPIIRSIYSGLDQLL